ncbi:MAG: hypothetical protein ACJ73E_09170 [Mycobacteriales bacterium]
MITPPSPLDWPSLVWSNAERSNFDLFRDCSDEPQVLAGAVIDQLTRSALPPLSDLHLLDYGAEPGGQLAGLLRTELGAYSPVPLAGGAEAGDFLARLTASGRGAAYDAVLLCHVLQYVRRADLVLAALAGHCRPDAVAVAAGLEPDGDQHDIALLARESDPAHPRRFDHIGHLDRWLASNGIPRRRRLVSSRARAADEQTLRRLVEFILGCDDEGLVDRAAAAVPRDPRGGYLIRTTHRLVSWPLRFHPPSKTPALQHGDPAGRTGQQVDVQARDLEGTAR